MIYYHNPNIEEPTLYNTPDDVLGYLYSTYPTTHTTLTHDGKIYIFYSRISIECDIVIRFVVDNRHPQVNILLEFRDQTFKLTSFEIPDIKTLSRQGLTKLVLECVQKGINNMHMIEKNLSSSILSGYLEGYKNGYSFDSYKALCVNYPHYAWVFEQVIADSNTQKSSYFQYIFNKGEVGVMLKLASDGADLNIPQPKQKVPLNLLSTIESMSRVVEEYKTWQAYVTGMTINGDINDKITETINRCYRTVVLDNLIKIL